MCLIAVVEGIGDLDQGQGARKGLGRASGAAQLPPEIGAGQGQAREPPLEGAQGDLALPRDPGDRCRWTAERADRLAQLGIAPDLGTEDLRHGRRLRLQRGKGHRGQDAAGESR